MQEIFEENRSNVLQGAIIWTPMVATDNLTAARIRETKLTDARVRHYWDPDRILGQLVSRTLNLNASTAWDVYLVYLPNHPWNKELPPVPRFWMHQLDEEPTLLLNPPRLKQYVQTVIKKHCI